MIRRIWIPLAGVTVAAALAIGLARAAGTTLPWQSSSPCRYANDPCWTHGKSAYSAMLQSSSSANSFPGGALRTGWSTVKLLNIGPDIPDLVAFVHSPRHGRVTSVWATINTGTGRRPLPLHRTPTAASDYMWTLGPVPDGTVVKITINYAVPAIPNGTRDESWSLPSLYGRITADGRPDRSAPVFWDPFAIFRR